MPLPFLLPLKLMCAGITTQSPGIVMCNQTVSAPVSLKVKIPPSRGTLRLVDCKEDLTSSGNSYWGGRPSDFNTQVTDGGWWIFRKRINLTSTPTFEFKRGPKQNNCVIMANVSAENAGRQLGAIYIHTSVEGDRLDGRIKYNCGDSHYTTQGSPKPDGIIGEGMGKCLAFAGSEIRMRLYITKGSRGSVLVDETSCGVQLKRYDFSQHPSPTEKDVVQPRTEENGDQYIEHTLKLPQGKCAVRTRVSDGKESHDALFLLFGKDSERSEIDLPTITVWKKDEVRVIKPQSASFVQVEVYRDHEVLWKSEQITADKKLDIDDTWTKKPSIICATAYSESLNSISGSCYSTIDLKEIPFDFF